ncbi:Spindle assembly checkpoint kinase [Tritrichomonas foetus]|uniref:Spindle assembly checkpoint kinase n=1 Tax=Tritrichomonas foetus TaxID=1144522 RepID=A0A1J4JAP3_9EUKA|nr:Spindle assembly checkpoint kinase [Tritrichomonas foetus]|eukprot:OHS96250.1 Spindle assembly checkpoint kinase [Tritrichomonas foetus]
MTVEEEDINLILEEHGYSLVKKVGNGSFGTVFLVVSKKYHTNFVVKQVSVRKNDNSEITTEITNLSSLSHPNIIKLYEYFRVDNKYYIIFEYCENGSLNDMIKNDPIRPPKLYAFCKQISAALAYCHSKHIAHRDIKPANILIDSYERLKLCDFGLSAQVSNGEKCKKLAGSFLFMAPEIFEKNEFDPYAADIYALGITFYMMATGMPPWYSSSVETLRKMARSCDIRFPPSVDRDFAHLIRSMVDPIFLQRPTINTIVTFPLLQQMNSALSLGEIKLNVLFNMPPPELDLSGLNNEDAEKWKMLKTFKIQSSRRPLISPISKKRQTGAVRPNEISRSRDDYDV